MKKLRLFLLPFAWLYGGAMLLRNVLYNMAWLKSRKIPVASICVGNLSVGGTGKSPLVDYLIDHFLATDKKVATLSRGYGRLTKGPLLAKPNSSATEIGDEPKMYLERHPSILVAVAEKRALGVDTILAQQPATDVIILDDAFQHRAVRTGLSILVTEYASPYTRDWMMPAGNLREPRQGAKRADIIVVSKCPTLSEQEKEQMKTELDPGDTPLFFSSIEYTALKSFRQEDSPDGVQNVLLVTGIGNPTPLLNYLKEKYAVTHLSYRDHHVFTEQDIRRIHEKFDTFASRDKIIVTTEKDFVRMYPLQGVSERIQQWFYQPIQIQIDKEEHFKRLLNNYVDKI